jgi:ketosteroid isomerase-like protein
MMFQMFSMMGCLEMDSRKNWEPAPNPEDLARFFILRANAGDVEGLVELYESDAVLAGPEGEIARGTEEIRAFYTVLLADRPQFEPGEQQPALCQGDLALTSSRLSNGVVTAEIARRQPDGTWLWAIDQPTIAKQDNGVR